MRTRLILYLVVLGPLVLSACHQQSVPSSAKRQSLVAAPDHFDAGDIRQYGKSECVFTLRNDTENDIEITQLKSSCACTVVEADSAGVKAHTAAQIKVALTPGPRVGPFHSFITVCWRPVNTLPTNELNLNLTYNAVRLVVTHPEICNFGDINADQSGSIQFEIERGEDKLPWDNIAIAPSNLPTTCQQISKDRYRITASFSVDKFPLGLFKDDLTVELLKNGVIAQKVIVPIQMRFVSNVTADPPTIYCGMIKLHSSQDAGFKIKSTKIDDLKVLSIKSSDPNFIQAKCIRSNSGELNFEYTTDSASPRGDHVGNFLITVQADKKRKILVPFIAFIE